MPWYQWNETRSFRKLEYLVSSIVIVLSKLDVILMCIESTFTTMVVRGQSYMSKFVIIVFVHKNHHSIVIEEQFLQFLCQFSSFRSAIFEVCTLFCVKKILLWNFASSLC